MEPVDKMRQLYAKAATARKEGRGDVAKAFRAGARRVQRQIKAEAIKSGANQKKASAE